MKAKYRMGDAVAGTKGRAGNMQVDACNLGKVGHVIGVRLLRGDNEHHYSIQYDNGVVDHADESCLRR